MNPTRNSGVNIMKYSEFVCSAVQLGISLDDILSETRKFHGRQFTSSVEKVVKTMMDCM